ncbi:mitochondrial resolvase Ydc2 [Lasiosphaeria miniovina]|uniref:Mitochondrial resolvase Ydc2 n=1 Tax=Lasiosphaeria miniovina TaxID=1954250 RepID=A0AA40A0A5_9PEZI|nr:mitochondrial resolvase Ydc2 [Lasiosphaeria miniovina]KAK0706952.1 mitochondrial resolvase Ydc2 [Lasiosphaeria miniovina]
MVLVRKPPQLQLKALRSTAVESGLPVGGIKSELVLRLRDAARKFTPVPANARILSIDLGIKNFAYSLITWTKLSTQRHSETPQWPGRLKVLVHEWKVVDLAQEAEAQALAATGTTQAAVFDPESLSKLALKLVNDRLLPLQPTHVLIERQRNRSSGSAAVTEWTLRVNSLESILYGILVTQQQQQRGDGAGAFDAGAIIPILSHRVGSYLDRELDAEAAVEPDSLPEKSVNIKKRKMSILQDWIRAGVVEPTTEDVRQQMSKAVLGKPDKPKRIGAKHKAEIGASESPSAQEGAKPPKAQKLDDLSDSLTQGIVWLMWQRNFEERIKEEPWLTSEGPPFEPDVEDLSVDDQKKEKNRKKAAINSATAKRTKKKPKPVPPKDEL